MAATQALNCPGISTLIYIFDTTAGIAKSAAAFHRSCAQGLARLALVAIALTAMLAASLAPAAGLPADLVQSLSPSEDAIKQYIAQAMIDLKSPDAAKQQAGRDALINYVAPTPNPPQPSPTFKLIYSQNLNAQLASIAGSQDLRTRLNAAIAAAKVAEKNDNEKLVPTITALLNDQSEAVALWGMKGAKFVIPRGPEGAKLVSRVVDSAKRFPSSSTVAYQTLAAGDAPTPDAIDAIHKLMEARSALYSNGVPPDALADTIGMRRLVDSKWWQAQTAAQQTKTSQLLINLAGAASQRVQANVSNDERESMAAFVRQINRCVAAIAELQTKPALKKKMDDGVRGLVNAASAQQIAQQADAIVAAVREAFPTLTAPPQLPATKPSPTTK